MITGKEPQGIYQMLRLGLSYQLRAKPYYLLLTEDWPSFTVEEDRAALEPAPGGPPPVGPPPDAPPMAAPAPDPRRGPPPNLGDFRPPAPPRRTSATWPRRRSPPDDRRVTLTVSRAAQTVR